MATQLPGKGASLWTESVPETDYPTYGGGVAVDVAVIGGGIAGLMTALQLKEAGKTVAVIEATRVGSGVTGHTTGKVSSLQQVIYQQIEKKFGRRGARIYGEANQAAIELVADAVEKYDIDCDFHREDNYTYALSDEELAKVKHEAKLAQELDLPASFVDELPIKVGAQGAVKFSNQAYFNAAKFCVGLARAVWGDGSHVFERTRATDVQEAKDGPCVVETEHGNLEASDVVICTNVPFLDRGLFFTRSHPQRSYIVAARLEDELPPGMYISAGSSPTGSILPVHLKEGDFLLMGGEGHKVGQGGKISNRYRALEQTLRGQFNIKSIEYHWSTQDGIPLDGVPYVGKLHPFAKHLYVATGFRKWGLTNGPAAAKIIKDHILGEENAWSKVFDSNRIKPLAGASKFVTENLNSGLQFVSKRLQRGGSLADLAEGEGRVLRIKGEQVAAYKDEDGNVEAVSAVCTHLQCIVDFNDAEQTWDCPCHGSRFKTNGEVLQGPAVKPLSKKEV
jgi:glycine/D-amino acid oxidase-like deaminating enzyme/nitrite reductase/ring-hydroxylating ferredoxin subunit